MAVHLTPSLSAMSDPTSHAMNRPDFYTRAPSSPSVKPKPGKAGKPRSATMNEQTFVPVSMRALYYSEVPVSNPPEGEEAAAEDASVKSILSPKTKASNPELRAIVTLDTEFPTPQPAPHQYLLKVQTAAFCQDELRLANALNPHPTTPEIPLHSICGTVICTPTADHEKPEGPMFKIGDQVFGVLSYTRDGGAADYTIATEDELALKPKNICTGEAAALALPALTAWQALFRYGGVDPDAAPNISEHEKNGNGHAEKPEPWNAPANGNTKANRRNSIRNSIAHISEHLNKRGFSNASGSSGPQRLRNSISHLNTQIQGRFIGNRSGKGNASIGHGLGEQRSMSMNEQESTNGSRRGSRNSLFPTRKVRPLRALITNARDSEVGRLAVQMLRARKLFTADRPWVCVTCSPAEERIVRGGWDVDGVIVIPHLPAENECAIGAEFRRMRWDPVDLVLDCTGGVVFRQAHFVVKDYGAVLTVVDPRPALEPENADEQDVFGRRKRGLRSMFVPVNPDAKALWRIVELVEEQMVRGREEQVVNLVHAAKLLEAGAAGVSGSRRGGMVVVRVNP